MIKNYIYSNVFFSRRKREQRRDAYTARDVPCEAREFQLSGARAPGINFLRGLYFAGAVLLRETVPRARCALA